MPRENRRKYFPTLFDDFSLRLLRLQCAQYKCNILRTTPALAMLFLGPSGPEVENEFPGPSGPGVQKMKD